MCWPPKPLVIDLYTDGTGASSKHTEVARLQKHDGCVEGYVLPDDHCQCYVDHDEK
jgi:hypothetical protein